MTEDRQLKWDLRYLKLAAQMALWSKDPSTKVGAVVVTKNNRIAGTGFNGFAPGADDHPDLYADRTYKYHHIIHAEHNALYSSQEVLGSTLYTSFPCCPRCAHTAVKLGVKRVVTVPLPIEGRDEAWIKQWEAWRDEAIEELNRFRVMYSIRHA